MSLSAVSQPAKHAVKTAIAAMVAIALCQTFQIPEGTWAVVSTVIVMQANIGGSLRAAWQRLLGTVIGAAIGVAHSWAIGTGAWPVGMALILTILVCATLEIQDSYRMASATTVMVMLADGPNAWLVGVYRFVDVIIGIIVAVVVSFCIWPARARDHLRGGLAQVLADSGRLHQHLVNAYLLGEYPGETIVALRDQVKQRMRQCRELLTESRREPGREEVSHERLSLLLNETVRILEQVLAMDEPSSLHHGMALPDPVIPKVTKLVQASSMMFGRLSQAIETGTSGVDPGELHAAVSAVDAELLAIREAGLWKSRPLEDVMRAFAFLHGMKRIAQDLARMSVADVPRPS
jgi:uncharacterized membrane protein YccC